MKHRRQEKYINLKPYDMWTDEDYKNAIPKEVRDAFDRVVNPKVQEQINKAKKGGEGMNYEKKYKEALLKAGVARQNTESAVTIGILEEIFPELKELEDERMRKWLEEHIEAMPDNSIEFKDVKRIDVLHWLEKQGEQRYLIGVDLGDSKGDIGVKTVWCGSKPLEISRNGNSHNGGNDDLEEAASQYPSVICQISPQWTSEVENVFKAGAQWQKEQMMKDFNNS